MNMKIFTEHPHWTQVLEVCTQLSKAGHRAFLAGGCVRDALMGTAPQDFDVATDATPDEVQEIFPDSLDVGKSFGVIIVPFEDFQIEVASFRQDGAYTDGRRPESVQFSSPEEDAKRRDFTVNALFYDWVDDKVIDYVNGTQDLDARLLRCVGEPEKRFREDHLRLVRAVRFHAQLGFELEEKTFKAVGRLAGLVADVSKERVHDEMLKLLRTKNRAEGVRLLHETKLADGMIPAFDGPWEESIETLSKTFQLTQEVNLWAAFLLNFGRVKKGKIKSLLRGLKCSNFVVAHVDKLVTGYWESLTPNCKPSFLRRQLAQLGNDLLELHRIQGEVDPKLSRWSELSQIPMDLPEPWITSDDLKSAGIPVGPLFGEILEQMFDRQLNGEISSREEALENLKDVSQRV